MYEQSVILVAVTRVAGDPVGGSGFLSGSRKTTPSAAAEQHEEEGFVTCFEINYVSIISILAAESV